MNLLRRRQPQPSAPPAVRREIPVDELRELSTVFAAPPWLERLGRASWLLVGVFGLIVALVWFLGATYTIGGPVVAATIVATVAMPLVSRLARHMPRAAAAVIVLLALVALAVVVLALVIGGITAQHDSISTHSAEAATKAQGWLESVGVVFGLSLAALSLFFLLKDGPAMRGWVDGHLGVPPLVARTITGGVITSLRGYFRGVTLVAAFNGVVVGIGALLLGVPLAGTIAVVSFVTAYVPFIGAFVAGAFAVIIALGAKGTTIALVMLLIVLLANGLLQNILQPFAMGSALDLHPLVVLVAEPRPGSRRARRRWCPSRGPTRSRRGRTARRRRRRSAHRGERERASSDRGATLRRWPAPSKGRSRCTRRRRSPAS